jgi:Dienelactone hydrolase and related enzymes
MSTTQPLEFLAEPVQDSGRSVLVLHAWWGLNDTVKAFCNRLAGAGFTAFAPDLYHGKIAKTIPEAETLSNALDGKQAAGEALMAAAYLSARAGETPRKIAVVGFSLGAYFALLLSTLKPELIQAVVTFYGTGPSDFSKAQAAYQGHFAEHDPYESAENVDALEQELRAAGRPVDFYRYPGTGHWFFEPDRTDAYNPAAAALAWERTLAFLKASL